MILQGILAIAVCLTDSLRWRLTQHEWLEFSSWTKYVLQASQPTMPYRSSFKPAKCTMPCKVLQDGLVNAVHKVCIETDPGSAAEARLVGVQLTQSKHKHLTQALLLWREHQASQYQASLRGVHAAAVCECSWCLSTPFRRAYLTGEHTTNLCKFVAT